MRAVSRRVVLILSLSLVVLLPAAVLIGRGIARVPEECFGVSGARVLGPGVHLVAPWSRPALYPAGELRVEADAEALTAEGARVPLTWSARVAARPAEAARLPARRAFGQPAAGFALDVAAAVQQDLLETAVPAAPLEARVRAALASRGLDVLSLKVEQGAAGRSAEMPAPPADAARRGPRPAPIALIGL